MMMWMDWLGFAASAMAYTLTIALVIPSRQSSAVYQGLLLLLVTGLIWSSVHLTARWWPVFDSWIFIAESLRLVGVLVFLCTLLRVNETRLISHIKQPMVLVTMLVAVLLPLANFGYWLGKGEIFIGYLALTLLALIYLEVLFRRSKSALWGLKPLILALGTLLIFDFIVLSNASLLNSVDQNMWLARGYLHALFVPFLFWSVKRAKSLGITVFVSREVVFQSSLLSLAGIYLTLMALTGFYIRSVGGQWSALIQVLFTVLAFVLLFALFWSDKFKRNARVFIQKHFFANQFDYRERWLGLTHRLSQPLKPKETVYQRALDAVCEAVDYASGSILKCQNDDLVPVASSQDSFNDQEWALINGELKNFIARTGWIVDLREYRSSVRHYPGLVIPYSQLQQVNTQVLIPVPCESGLWGVLTLRDKEPKKPFDWEIRDYVTVVAEQVAHYIIQYEATEKLTENAQFAAFSRMSAFVVHDIKNVLAQIRMIVRNAERHKHNPEFIDDAMETLQSCDSRMQKMLDQLTAKNVDETKRQDVCIESLIQRDVLPKCQGLKPIPSLHCDGPVHLSVDAEKLANVIYHLVDNAQQATPDDGTVSIKLTQREHKGIIVVEDTGSGMSPDFIEHQLFAPFVTTKGNAGMGIGAYDAKQFIEASGGRIQVESEPGKGTRFTLLLPLTASEER